MNRLNLYRHLETNPSWQYSSDIFRETGIKPREVRELCQNFPQTFIGSNNGYKLVRNASSEEVEHAIQTLLSRAEKVMHRARSLQRYSLERNKVTNKRLLTMLRER